MNGNSELADLLGKLCNDDVASAEAERLTELLRESASNREFYADYLDVHLTLVDNARRSNAEVLPTPDDALRLDTSPRELSSIAPSDAAGRGRLARGTDLFASVAVLVLISALGVWWLAVHNDGRNDSLQQLVQSVDRNPPSQPSAATSDPLYVAQVTDLTADVTWGKTAASQEFLLRVRRGDRIEVVSGLVQLDYFAGAQILLQGPCAFVPTGDSSGRIEYGNLTGNVSRGDFVLTTPTAKVIDLGTEFGVSVDGVARTDVCVFDGEVQVLSSRRGKDGATSVLLREGMTARVASGGQFAEAPELDLRDFTRELPTSQEGALDGSRVSLVDLLSGSIASRRRLAGVIAPDTGDSDRHPWLRIDGPGYSVANGYRETGWHPFVDGVFIPSESGKGITIDSTGNVVDLPPSTGRTWGPIWSRRRMPGATDIASQEDYWGTDTLEGVIARLSHCEIGMIGIHANVGVTFDLESVRRNFGQSATKFEATVCNLDNSMKRLPKWAADKRFTADVRVFVDGELRDHQLDFGRDDGELKIRAELSQLDRYFTVVCTDAAKGEVSGYDAYDHVVLIDPVLSLSH